MNNVLAVLAGVIGIVLPGFGQPAVPTWNGYVEADYIYAAAASGGSIATFAVREGDVVAAGQVLFTLSDSQQRALLDAATAQVKVAEANLSNLQTGSRSEELQVVRASLDKAAADQDLAEQSFARSQKLFAQGLVPAAKLDQDRATLASATAQVQQLQAQLKVQELPARDAQQIAAEASLAAAQANAQKAMADLADRTVLAPAAGRVEKLYYDAGEMVAAGAPVVSLAGAQSLTVKFYVNEAQRPTFAIGDRLAVSCDGCADGLVATVSRFASQPQFTPPIIYSRDERNRLVFETEAVLTEQSGILPGQPVGIRRLD
jgi:HlyD family secretion protein